MAKVLEKFPVTKNGKFFGYADASQIASNASLELFDAQAAAVAEARVKIEAAEAKKAAEDADAQAAADKGADPAAVRKAPASAKK